MNDERRRGGFGAAFVLLIFVGAIVKFWMWIAVAFGAAVVFGLLLWAAFYAARRVDARENARLAIGARADEQHAQIMAGDDRGIYGAYPPAIPPGPPPVAERMPHAGENWADYLAEQRRKALASVAREGFSLGSSKK